MKPSSMILARIVGNIRRLRAKLDVTQEYLAEHTGLTQTYISLLESGKRGISFDNLRKIASVLEVYEIELIMSEDQEAFHKLDMLDNHQKDKLLKLIEIYIHPSEVDPSLVQSLDAIIEATYLQISGRQPTKKPSN